MIINAYRRRSPRVCLARRLSRESGCIDFETSDGWRTLSAGAVLNTPWKDTFPASIFRGGLGHESLDDSMGFVVVVVR